MKSYVILLLLMIEMVACSQNTTTFVSPDNPNIAYSGRFDYSDKSKPVFMYSGCSIRTVFWGTSVTLLMKDESLRNMFTVVLDDSLFVLTANRSDNTYVLAENLKNDQHTLEISRRTEWHGGNTTFLGFQIEGNGELLKPATRKHKVEFIGDSYTCGYGIEGLSQKENFKYETENNYLTFGAITARELDADYYAVCRSGIGIVQGYGGKKEFTMPHVYDEVINDSPLKWDYSRYQPQLVVIDLISNDLSAPLDSATFISTYIEFLKRIRTNYANSAILCIAGPSSPGKQWITVQNYMHAVVDEFTKTDKMTYYFMFSPFEPHGSDWHPNISEHRKMADELIPYVKQLMNW